MENILPANVPASSSPATAWEQFKHRASAPPTSLAEAQELLTALLAQQEVLLEENRHLHTVQQTLATSEARLQAAEAIAHLGSYELDLRSGAVQFSAGMYQLFGETPQMGTPSVAWMDSRTHPDDVPTIRRILAQARRNRQPYWYSRRIRRPDGQWRNLVSHGRVVCDAAGTAIRLESVVEDQTEARDAAQELLTAKEQLQVSLDNSLYVVQAFKAVRDDNGHIVDFTWVYANKAWTDRYGEPVGKSLLTENPGVVVNGLFEQFVQVTHTGVPVDHEHYYSHEQFDGWFHQTLVKMGDGFVMHTEDINARKQAEQQLQASRELLQATLDSSPSMVQVFEAVRDEQGEIVDFRWILNNQAAENIYGDVIGQLLLTQNPGVVAAGIFDTFKRVVETGCPDQSERYYAQEQFDGWFHQSTVKLHDGVATTTADITGRKEAEQQLRQNLQQLKQAEQVAQLGSWEYEPATDTLRWSAGMYRLFDLPVGTPVQLTTYLDYVLTEDRQLAQRLMHQLQHSPQAMEETVRINVRGGVTSLKIKATVLRNTAGQPVRVLGVDMDVSEVIRLEQENLRLRLEQQNQLLFAILDAQEEERHRIAESLHNGVGQLLYATKLNLHRVAHLLPAPEGALSAMVAKTEHLLGTAIAETRRVSHELIPILLKEYGLDKALKDFCSHFASSGIAFSCHGLTERLSPYLETAIYRIAQELINNIIKHAQATRARLEVTRDAHGLCIEAQDDGVGLVTRTPFTGIGLKIIEDRVTLLNGTLQLESAPGQGTLITICIPLP